MLPGPLGRMDTTSKEVSATVWAPTPEGAHQREADRRPVKITNRLIEFIAANDTRPGAPHLDLRCGLALTFPSSQIPRAARRLAQLRNLLEARLDPRHNPQLRNPLARLDLHRRAVQVRHHHPNLPPCIRIDHSRQRRHTPSSPAPTGPPPEPRASAELHRNYRRHRCRRSRLDPPPPAAPFRRRI